jgi:fatty acid synthase subunit beta
MARGGGLHGQNPSHGGNGTGPQTGVSTPRSSSSLRPLGLSHGTLEYTVLIPTAIHYHASELKDHFAASLPPPTDELAQDDEPSSVAELVARFLGYISRQVDEDDDSNGSYEEVLKLILNEFERAFLRGNDVHALASSLPGITQKKLVVVQSYFSARASASRPIRAHPSALLRAASDEEASIYSVFGGQGNIEEYFDELREVYTTYPSFLENLIPPASDMLQNLSRNPKVSKMYPQGLSVMKWLGARDSQPDTDYLVSAPVSLPLIGLVQLAHYTVTCRSLGLTPGEVRERFSGTTGHSQGIITAAAIAAADSWESFNAAARTALTMLFWTGARCQQAYPRTSLAPSTLQDSLESGEGTPTPMLSVRDLSREAVQEHIDATNTHLPKDRHIAISLVNSAPSRCTV